MAKNKRFMRQIEVRASELAVLAATVALVLLAGGCGRGVEEPEAGSGQAIYVKLNCSRCHGLEREGTRGGPPLGDLTRHWDETTLTEYLSEPEPVRRESSRLLLLSERFAVSMPPLGSIEKDRESAIVRFLLEPTALNQEGE